MKERPILFFPPMVRAILDGSKTQTRRVVNPQPIRDESLSDSWIWHGGKALERAGYGAGYVHTRMEPLIFAMLKSCPYGQPGDRLWVRENFSGPHCMGNASPSKWAHSSRIWYWADGNPTEGDWTSPKPSIHMPRWASRIDLEITGVRVERLQDCSEADAIAEGIHSEPYVWRDCEYPLPDIAYRATQDATRRFSSPRDAYRDLWESINGPGTWDANPWVWVIEFRRIKP
jgi:hypothetical protein